MHQPVPEYAGENPSGHEYVSVPSETTASLSEPVIFAAYSDEVLERVSRALVFVIPRVFRKSIKYFMWS